MDITICDITALHYWRIPPVVQLLATAPQADARLARLLTDHDFDQLSANYVAAQEKFKKKHSGGPGEIYRMLMDAVPLLSLCGSGPFDVLSTYKGEVRESGLVKPRLWRQDLPVGSIREATSIFGVTSPEFTLQQTASHMNFGQTLLVATEFCGGFSVFQTPEPMAGIIQRLCNQGRLPKIGGWSPCLDSNGALTDLWSREPLTTPTALQCFAAEAESPLGRERLARTAKFVVAGAASPFEAQVGILLGLPTRCGGAGLSGFVYNKRIGLAPDAALIAQRSCCYCDLYWDEGVDLECHSKTWHAAVDSQLSDFSREAALDLMGIDVVPVTHEQVGSKRKLDAIARIIAGKLDRKLRVKNSTELKTEARLRNEVLNFDWH